MTGLDSTAFQALFDTARHSVFRLEGRQTYAIPADDDELVAFRTGAPRPERSVRTSPWLRRIAMQAAGGVEWCRLRVVEFPLTEYTRFEMVAFVESQAAGEQIRLTENPAWVHHATDGSTLTAHAGPGAMDDFWLIDGGTPDAVGVWMKYDDDGHLLAREPVRSQSTLAALASAQEVMWSRGIPLNVWLADCA